MVLLSFLPRLFCLGTKDTHDLVDVIDNSVDGPRRSSTALCLPVNNICFCYIEG